MTFTQDHGEFNFECRFIQNPSKTIIPIRGRCAPFKDDLGSNIGYIGVVEDISTTVNAKKLLEDYNKELEKLVAQRTEELSISRTRLKQAMNLAKIGYWNLDIEQNFKIHWSDEYKLIYDVVDNVNDDIRFFLPFTHKEDRENLLNLTSSAIQKGKDVSFDYRIITAAGALKHIRSNIYCKSNDAGQTTQVFGIIQDMSELVSAQNEMQNALKRSNELSSLKSRFVAMASHEFRTPLTTILSSTELIDHYRKTTEYDRQHKHIGKIRSSVKNLKSILDDFLSLEKIEENKVELQEEKTLLSELFQTVRSALPPIKKEQLRIIHQGPDEIDVDKYLITNILINLISNAIKYSPKEKAIIINSTRLSTKLIITIADQGIGIPEVDQGNMFRRFFRASNVSDIKGTGLGLVIVQRYLDLMSGSISFTSTLGKGTIFKIEIPQKQLKEH